jgi:hypothetical protein
MGFIGRLFGLGKGLASAYPEAGARLTRRLVESLNLEGWENSLPNYYTSEEVMLSIGRCCGFSTG